MPSFSHLLVAGLAAVAAAAPAVQPTCKVESRNANFEDLRGIPAIAINRLPTPYMGLFYQGFSFVETIPLTFLPVPVPGVTPHSGVRYAASGLVGQTTGGTPMLTTNYKDSIIKRFDLESFYFGCSLNTENGIVGAPTACNINISGYQGSDNSVSNAKQVCSQQFQYNPTTTTGQQQQAFSGRVASCFKDMQFAIVTYTLPGGMAAANTLLGLLLDDIKYTTYTCKK